MRGWRYSSTYFESLLHAPTALLPGDKHQVLIGQEAGWTPEQTEHGDEVDIFISTESWYSFLLEAESTAGP
jgi:hypothetical protein